MVFGREPNTNLVLGRFVAFRGFYPILAKVAPFNTGDPMLANTRPLARWGDHCSKSGRCRKHYKLRNK